MLLVPFCSAFVLLVCSRRWVIRCSWWWLYSKTVCIVVGHENTDHVDERDGRDGVQERKLPSFSWWYVATLQYYNWCHDQAWHYQVIQGIEMKRKKKNVLRLQTCLLLSTKFRHFSLVQIHFFLIIFPGLTLLSSKLYLVDLISMYPLMSQGKWRFP